MAKKKFYGEYEGYKGRKDQEASDAGMLREDRSAQANMPQGVIMKNYPASVYGGDEGYNDRISGIDSQMREDSHSREIKKGNKY